ncbi:ABC transporter substrate-binding protein [Alkalibacterium iburiense]|uniref:ABC transporter substrate-binding protein n=1 Tax=Alkalibacterium iburiense TaxID=290589 RepID=A0ABN0XK53_9LACT
MDIEIQNATGDAYELLSLQLSGGEYADIVMMDLGSDLPEKYINSGALLPLNDLIEEKGSDIKEMYADILDRTVHDDGKNYYLNNWYGDDDTPVDAFNIRFDYMVDIVGEERARSSEPFSQDEFVSILKEWKEINPEVNGEASIPLTIRENASGFEGMFGMKTYYENEGRLYHIARDPQYLKMRKFQNNLLNEGLLDPEWVTNNETLKNQKLASGNVFATQSAYWDTQGVNQANVAQGNENQQYVAYKVYANDIDPSKTTYGGRNSFGWDAIGITDNAENVDAAFELINFLASREGQNLLLWGIEGEHYTVDEDGNFHPTDDTLTKFQEDTEAATNETGINRWTWFVNNQGPTEETPNRLTEYISRQAFDSEMAFQNMEGTYWDNSYYSNLSPEPSSPLGLRHQSITDIVTEAVPQMVNAASEQEVETIYNNMISRMEEAGLEEVEEYINEKYQERLELWGMN